MKRREFIKLIGVAMASAACPFAANTQQPQMPVIGYLGPRSLESDADLVGAFRRGLNEIGFVEGHNVLIEYRWADGQFDRLPALAAELVRRPAGVIAASSPVAALAAKAATMTVPIVFVTGVDPVKLGVVDGLARPGGNVTGVTFFGAETASKRLGLLRELVPNAALIAVLINPKFPDAEGQLRDAQEAARALQLQLIVLKASNDQELERAFATMAQQGAGGLVVGADSFFFLWRGKLAVLAAHHAIPAIYALRDYATAGGLMSYGTDFVDAYRQAGTYAGRIIKGERPADLPVLRSTKFEFVINLKTAKALGLAVPNSMQLLADEVIE
jgi:putative tryptophan/tyrosine transport system substrate-binding protein